MILAKLLGDSTWSTTYISSSGPAQPYQTIRVFVETTRAAGTYKIILGEDENYRWQQSSAAPTVTNLGQVGQGPNARYFRYVDVLAFPVRKTTSATKNLQAAAMLNVTVTNTDNQTTELDTADLSVQVVDGDSLRAVLAFIKRCLADDHLADGGEAQPKP